MCSINHDLKAIFIHTQKNGGLYVQTILEQHYNFKTICFTRDDHEEFNDFTSTKPTDNNGFMQLRKKGVLRYFESSKQYNELANMNEEKWNSYYKFSIIRNPYDKIVSTWKYLKIKNLINDISFENFIKEYSNCNDYAFTHAFISQYDHLLDTNNELKINYNCKFENLNEELVIVLNKLGCEIKHPKIILDKNIIDSLNNKENYCINYNDEIIGLVNNYFKDDFEKFNFKMCKNTNELIEDSTNYFFDLTIFINQNKNLIDRYKIGSNVQRTHVEKSDILKNLNNPEIMTKLFTGLFNSKPFYRDTQVTYRQKKK